MNADVTQLVLDTVILSLVVGFGVYGLRSFLFLVKDKELVGVNRLWLPITASGFFFFLWAVEDILLDFLMPETFTEWGMIVTKMTLIVAISLFSAGIIRFSRIWHGYVKKRDESIRTKNGT